MNILVDYLYRTMCNYPDAIIYDGIEKITYNELLEYAKNNYSQYYHKKYGIVCDSAINTVKALFCCMFAGATAVILSNRYGESTKRKIIDKVKLSYLIDDNGIQKIHSEMNEVEDLSDVAYIMCTSGTTGVPKAAMLTYEGVFCNLLDILKYFKINCQDKVLITRPLCHAAALTGELLLSLASGADVILLCNNNYNPFDILKTIYEEKITVFCTTPTVINQIASFCNRRKNKTFMNKIAVSGECMTNSIARNIVSAFPETEIYNVYGLTEASPRVSYLSSDKFIQNPCSVGKPLDSVSIKVVDGELYVKGKNVMKGYYDDVELTHKVIVNGWLKTGDQASFGSDEQLYIHGRVDDMIIRAGINIYPQEIEDSLMKDERIKNALAYRIKTESTGDKIGVKIVSSCISKEEAFEICKALLPNYQIPDVIDCVDDLIKNEGGKLVRT